MVNFIPGGQGLYSYPNAGKNDFEALGGLLNSLAGSLGTYRVARDQMRTLGDLVPRPGMKANPAATAPSAPNVGMNLMNSLRSYNGASPFGMPTGGPADMGVTSRPTPLGVPAAANPLQSLIYGQGMQGVRVKDLTEFGHLATLQKALQPDYETMLHKYLLNEYLQKKISDTGEVPMVDDVTGEQIGMTKKGTLKLNRTAKPPTPKVPTPIDPEKAQQALAKFKATKRLEAFKLNPELGKTYGKYVEQAGKPVKGGWWATGLTDGQVKALEASLAKIDRDAEIQFKKQPAGAGPKKDSLGILGP